MKPTVLIIMDGFGIAKPKNNAIATANTKNLDYLFKKYPTTNIEASGLSVGLPKGQMGNSEVGHTNIGAGRIVYQDLTRISKSVKDKTFFKNKALKKAINHSLKNNSSLHIMGLLSDGGVHSHIDHLFAILELIKDSGLKEVYIHAFLDGRDTPPDSGKKYLNKLLKKLNDIGTGKIATISGRYYAMDRDNRWERIEKVYKAIVEGNGNRETSPTDAIEKSYKNNITDEFFYPTIIDENGIIKDNDSIIFFNFRPDRARQITKCFVYDKFNSFKRNKILNKINFVCLTEYDKSLSGYVDIAFEPEVLKNTLGEYVSCIGLKQLRIAETEKYAHVTFFFNGGIEKKYNGEDRILIPSPKVATYDLQPEMSAFIITEKVINEIKSNKYDIIILNFANCDMVGHTGNFDATVKAVESVDLCVKKIVDEVLKYNGCAFITADHGNADKMKDDFGKPFTAHTTNPVPFCVVGYECSLKSNGKLSDIAPSILDILNIKIPSEMTGNSLIIKNKGENL